MVKRAHIFDSDHTVSEDESISKSSLFTKEEILNFKLTLLTEKNKILSKAKSVVKSGSMKLDTNDMMDEMDLASATMEQNLTFRLLDRERKLLGEIEHALKKISHGEYGYCEGTGDPIPKRRLELTPWCRHSVKHKEFLERMKKTGRGLRDDDDREEG
jgi:DnaK suppressor protein